MKTANDAYKFDGNWLWYTMNGLRWWAEQVCSSLNEAVINMEDWARPIYIMFVNNRQLAMVILFLLLLSGRHYNCVSTIFLNVRKSCPSICRRTDGRWKQMRRKKATNVYFFLLFLLSESTLASGSGFDTFLLISPDLTAIIIIIIPLCIYSLEARQW